MNKDAVSTQQKHDADPLGRRLSTEMTRFIVINRKHDYDLDNLAGIYAYVNKNSLIKIQFDYELPNGFMEWTKSNKYVLSGKPITKDSQTTPTETGLIESSMKTFYRNKLGSKSLFAMAEEVLLSADLTLTEWRTHPWEIDKSLKQMFTTATLPTDAHMNCLQLIAHAAHCHSFTDDDNVIHTKPLSVTVTDICNGQQADNNHLWYSEWRTVGRSSTNENTYTVFELNCWTLDDGSQVIIPDDNLNGRGYISEAMTSAGGTFTAVPVPTRTFDVSHDLPVVAIHPGTPMDEYPASIQMKYYKDTVLLDTQTVSVDSTEALVSSSPAIDCIKIEVSFLSGFPYRRMRIGKVYYRETGFTLDFSSIARSSQAISEIDGLKAITVARYSYAASNSTTNLCEKMTTEAKLHVEFSDLAQDIQVNVPGRTPISSNIYARAVDLVLSSGTKIVVTTERTLQENSVVVPCPIILIGEVDRERNPLIANDDMCPTLADHVKSYLQVRNIYDTDYHGNPEVEVGDIIGLQTRYIDEMDALILVDEISFNGSLSGKMKVKGLT